MNRYLKLLIISILIVITNNFALSKTVIGKVISSENKEPIAGAKIGFVENQKVIYSDNNGEFKINLDAKDYTLIVSAIGWSKKELKLSSNETNLLIELSPQSVRMQDVYVYGASKKLEKITESPSAINMLDKIEINRRASSGKITNILNGEMGIDVLQNGANDYIINSRGFNGGLHRRVLVLQDGRDAAMPLLGAQEWNSFPFSPDDYSRIEFVRGPSAALYGANSYNGVLNLITYSPKEILGTKISVLGGDFNTMRTDVRHAGIFGNLSYKITLGHSEMLNYSKSRDNISKLEYPGLAVEKKVLTNDDRQTFATYGTLRLDYDLDESRKIASEFGFSNSGNETFVFGLGRTLVKNTNRPYVRFAYNSENLNIHTHYMQRSVSDSMWLLVPNAPLLDNSKDFMIDVQHNFDLSENLKVVWGLSEQLQWIRTSGTSIPNDVDANYTGLYGQFDWELNDIFKIVASARFDYASIHPTQFSPRLALVTNLNENHNLRLAIGRAFQRPNYSELFRLTPDAPAFDFSGGAPRPVNFVSVQQKINDTLTALTGIAQNLNFNLDPFRAKAIGNENLDVEKIISLELGYKGVINEDLYLNIEIYYNKLNDFITNFLPGINPKIQKWEPDLEGNLAQYNDLVKEIVYSYLTPRDQQRLSIVDGLPTFVVSNANVGEVDEYGIEVEARYYFNEKFNINANYSYFGYKVIKSNISQPIVPNTSPHRLNLIVSYNEQNNWDTQVTLQYSAGFDWLAGTYIGYVPDWTVVNLNSGVYILDNLRLGINVFNLFNRKFYQIFGGTYLPRYTTAQLTYTF